MRDITGVTVPPGGSPTGELHGANLQPGRPAPPNAAERYASEKTTAVSEAMGMLDDEAPPEVLARRIKAACGMDIPIWEVEAIRARIRRGQAPRE